MYELFLKGGPIMWPLLIVSITALTVIFERVFFLLSVASRRDEKAEESFFAAISEGRFAEAISVGENSRDYVVRVLTSGISHQGAARTNALLHSAGQELRRFARGLTILDTAITISPLLGLLGTVTGMIHAFGLLGAAELSAPTVITGGIAEALIATAFGLGIAICSLLPFNYLTSKVEEARHEIEQSSSRLELLLDRKQTANL